MPLLLPCFFANGSGHSLYGLHRKVEKPAAVWLVCPPFAEEDKSARRVLTEVCEALNSGGEDTFLISYFGTGDSQGDFAHASIPIWLEDIKCAANHLKKILPGVPLKLLGVRLGATLALQLANELAAPVCMIEPLQSGRSFLMQQNARKQIRAQMTEKESGEATAPAIVEPQLPDGIEDLDGWALGPALKDSLKAVDAKKCPAPPAGSAIYQVGPREEVSPALVSLAAHLNCPVHAVVMPAFWNLLDYAPATPLIGALTKNLTSSETIHA